MKPGFSLEYPMPESAVSKGVATGIFLPAIIHHFSLFISFGLINLTSINTLSHGDEVEGFSPRHNQWFTHNLYSKKYRRKRKRMWVIFVLSHNNR